MKYFTVNIFTSETGIEAVVGKLLTLGITDVVIDDPRDIEELMDKKNSYDWDYLDEEVTKKLNCEPKVIIYMEENLENKALIDRVKAGMLELIELEKSGDIGCKTDLGTLEVTVDIDNDFLWKDKWKEYFKPAKISEHIVIKPTWEKYEKKQGEIILAIDPGMAFGTGTHETTYLCVRMLEKYIKKGDKILDVGCGSGILSIAAAYLGAKEVLGVDIDPIAVSTANENIRINKVESMVRAEEGDLTKGLDFKADIVVANLMADLVMMLSEDVKQHLCESGIFISSGILIEKKDTVSRAIEKCGFEILEIAEAGEWCCIVASN